jgi:hypothetical protein
MFNRFQSKTFLAGALFAFSALASSASADILYFQSATTTFTGLSADNFAGVETDSTFYSGVDFQVTSPIHVTQIGGLFASGLPSPGNIFGAIIPVASLSTAPNALTITNTAVAHTLLTLPATGGDVENISGSVSVNLAAGSYALVFGSGLYGATASAAATESVASGSVLTTTGGETTYALRTSDGTEFLQAAGARYFVDVPEPTSALLLFSLSTPTLLGRRRRQRSLHQ